MKVAREFRPLVKRLEAMGYIVDIGRKHPHLRTAEGKFVAPIPRSTGCPRALKNWKLQLRQRGVDIN